MPTFLVDHFDGCTPLQPCNSCQAANFLRSRLKPEDFNHLIEIAGGKSVLKQAPLDTLIKTLPGLSARSYNGLRNDNIQTIGELIVKTGMELLRIPNFGRRSLAEVESALMSVGHALKKKD